MRHHQRGRFRRTPAAPSLENLVLAAAHASAGGFDAEAAAGVDRLVARCDREPEAWLALSPLITRLMVAGVGQRWAQGWQPADLVHAVGRVRRAVHRQACAVAVDIDAAAYRHSPGADPGWLAQVRALVATAGLPSAAGGGSRPLIDVLAALTGSVHAALLTVVETLGVLQRLPSQPRLCPPPSEWGSAPPAPATGRRPDPKIIDRVRGLLAKAESTTFPDEADAFTAKAQQLIARHAIDLALLEGRDDGPGAGTVARRVLIDDPYGRAKSVLVSVIAEANRCRAVFSDGLGLSTVFGAPADLDAVEMLFASLLTQATAAMAAAGRSGGARTRGRGFRQSFLLSFAHRIGQRLAQATAAAVEEACAAHGDDLLPVLASRDEAAEQARDRAFPRLRGRRLSLSSPEGWVAGRAAADLARLGPDGQLHAG